MESTGKNLRFASGRSVGSFTGGRGEVAGALHLLYHHDGEWINVVVLQEFDRRPFYDAWESQEVESAQLLELPDDAGLAIVVRSLSDAEWNVGGPAVSIATYRSQTGAVWLPVAWEHDLMSRALELEVLRAKP